MRTPAPWSNGPPSPSPTPSIPVVVTAPSSVIAGQYCSEHSRGNKWEGWRNILQHQFYSVLINCRYFTRYPVWKMLMVKGKLVMNKKRLLITLTHYRPTSTKKKPNLPVRSFSLCSLLPGYKGRENGKHQLLKTEKR